LDAPPQDVFRDLPGKILGLKTQLGPGGARFLRDPCFYFLNEPIGLLHSLLQDFRFFGQACFTDFVPDPRPLRLSGGNRLPIAFDQFFRLLLKVFGPFFRSFNPVPALLKNG